MPNASRPFVVLATVLLVGCGVDRVHGVSSGVLRADPAALDFPHGWVGHSEAQTVVITNRSQAPATVDVSITAPFGVDVTSITVPADSTSTLTVAYAPGSVTHDTGQLFVGPLMIPLTGDAKIEPSCPSTACSDARFDETSGACTPAPKPDGTACANDCTTGVCDHGTCVGTFDACDDHDACTVDVCSGDTGCGHVAVSCPVPLDPCQLAVCDHVTGCGTAIAADGTACGPDDCTLRDVKICVSGQCTLRPRPMGTCNGTWVPATIPSRWRHAMAYDSDRHVLVVFGGQQADLFGDTWEWDGTRWQQRFPSTAPSARNFTAMVYDPSRKRTLLFGGSGLGDTWTWDGTQWTQLSPAHSPAGREMHAMAYDSDRERVVLYGGTLDAYGSTPGAASDTWEWDGTDWTQVPATGAPVLIGHSMAYDPLRHQMVMFGGQPVNVVLPGLYGQTWTYDGASWTSTQPVNTPPLASFKVMAFLPSLGQLVLTGGFEETTSGFADTWAWDGANWTKLSPAQSPLLRDAATMVYDPDHGRLLLFGGTNGIDTFADTWSFDGNTWSPQLPLQPVARPTPATAFDSTRGVMVMFGGGSFGPSAPEPLSDTWEWDGTLWRQAQPALSPPGRRLAAMAFDSARARTVLFGGALDEALLAAGDTWEWDGTSWTQMLPAHSPPARWKHALAYDSTRQRVVLFGGESSNGSYGDTWEWNGIDWTQPSLAVQPDPRVASALSFDQVRHQLVLFGGCPTSNGPWTIAPYADTWTYDGYAWVKLSPAHSPTARCQHGLAYSPTRQITLMFGGLAFRDQPWDESDNGETTAETWAWDGTDWTQPQATGAPIAGQVQLLYDPGGDRFVWFGSDWSGSGGTNDIWLYSP